MSSQPHGPEDRWFRISEAELRSISHDVIRDHFADEIELFSVLWSTWSRLQVSRRLQERIRIHGLPAVDHSATELSSPFVILTIAAVMDHLPNPTEVPDRSAIEQAVGVAAHAFGLDESQVTRLVEAISPRLHEAFLRLSSAAPTSESPAAVADRSSRQVAETMSIDGKRISLIPCGESEATELRSQQFDILIDEPENRIIVKGQLPQPIHALGTYQRAMMWLVLTHVGKYVLHSTIQTMLDFDGIHDSSIRDRIYQVMRALKLFVGSDLHGRMLESGAVRRYPVRSTGWSWCWIREGENPTSSELLYGLPGRPSECQ